MDDIKIFTQASAVVAGASFVVSFAVIHSYSGMLFNSLFAAAMAAGFVWLGYITLRWLILVTKGK